MKRTVALLLALSACSRSAPPSPIATGTATPTTTTTSTATATATAAPTPTPTATATAAPIAAPTGPAELPVTSAGATVAAREQPLSREAVTVVDPGAQFHVEVPVALPDARLSLLDGDGAMVPATGGAEIGGGRTRFHLAPDAPLVPGSSYALKLDGAVERNPRDPEGRSYVPASWALLTTGEKPKTPAKPQKQRRRGR